MTNYADDYTEFNNEAAELLEEQSPVTDYEKTGLLYPLSDRSTIVSYSEIYKLQTCKRQYYYRFDLGLKPTEESGPISTGVKGHKLLENFYRYLADGETKEHARALTTQSAQNLINQESKFDSTILPAWLLVDNYIRETDFTAEAILIENRFLFPASEFDDDPALAHVQIGFTPDVVLQRKGGFIDVEDYKFVQRAWSNAKIERYQQSKLYQIFLKRMGYNVSRSILRFFNVQTTKVTVKPYTLEANEEETIIRDFMAGVREVIEYKEKPNRVPSLAPRTMCYTACGFCAFSFPCDLEAKGKDASKTLNSLYVKNEYDYTR